MGPGWIAKQGVRHWRLGIGLSAVPIEAKRFVLQPLPETARPTPAGAAFLIDLPVPTLRF